MRIRLALAGTALAAASAFAPANAADLVFMLDNQSSTAVHEFYASPVEVTGWRDNILGQDLEPGNRTRLTLHDDRSTCNYDLKIIFSDNEELDEQNINLCETGGYTISDPESE